MTVDVAVTTADQLLALPDDGMRHELVRGEHRVMSPSGARHSRIGVRIAWLLQNHLADRDAGVVFGADCGFVLEREPDTVRSPDAAFVSRERAEAVGDTEKFWPGPPDFAAEVVSPSDTFTEVEEKALLWLDSGCKLVLVLDPKRRTATVYSGEGHAHTYREVETLDLDSAVPGWRPTVAELLS